MANTRTATMSVLSITAPQFTIEDERVERELLTMEDEFIAARDDIYGTASSCTASLATTGTASTRSSGANDDAVHDDDHDVDADASTSKIEEELERTIHETIPYDEKQAYMEALHLAPEIVATESNLTMFLRSENYNVWAAAERLVNYWELRLWLFGPDRAFLPMTLTGDGALNEQDIQLLRTTTAVLILPRRDDFGRRILYIEESRLFNSCATKTSGNFCASLTTEPSEHSDENKNCNEGDIEVATPDDEDGAAHNAETTATMTRRTPATETMSKQTSSPPSDIAFDRIGFVRVIFYFLSVLMEDEETQKKGIVVIANHNDYHTSRFDRKYYKYLTYLFTGYHPANTRAFHIVAPAGKSCFLLVLPFIKYFMTKHLRLRLKLHQGTVKEVTIDLQDLYGIPTDLLPTSLNGQYEFAAFLQEYIDNYRLAHEAQRELELKDLHDDIMSSRLSSISLEQQQQQELQQQSLLQQQSNVDGTLLQPPADSTTTASFIQQQQPYQQDYDAQDYEREFERSLGNFHLNYDIGTTTSINRKKNYSAE